MCSAPAPSERRPREPRGEGKGSGGGGGAVAVAVAADGAAPASAAIAIDGCDPASAPAAAAARFRSEARSTRAILEFPRSTREGFDPDRAEAQGGDYRARARSGWKEREKESAQIFYAFNRLL